MGGMILKKLTALGTRGYFSSATVELTARCNLSCRYCFVRPDGPEMTTDEICRMFDKLADAGVLTLMLTGGEVFVRDDILEILDYIGQKNFLMMSILSNGTLIGKEHVDYLSDHRNQIGFVRLSFFSHDPSIHDSFTGVPGSFERALHSALVLRGRGVNVPILINLIDENVDTLAETKRFFSEQGFTVSEGVTKIAAADGSGYCEQLISESFFERYFKGFADDELSHFHRKPDESQTVAPKDSVLCQRLFSSIAIRADGSIVPCIAFRDHSVADIREVSDDLQKVLRDSALIRELHELKVTDVAQCASCEHIRMCLFCPGMMYSENRSFLKPVRQNCNYIKALNDVSRR